MKFSSGLLPLCCLLYLLPGVQAQTNQWRGFAKPQYYPFNICSPVTKVAKANCPNHLMAKDLDGDGDLDIILDARLYQNQSSQGPKIKKASFFLNQGDGTLGKEIIFEKPDQYAFIGDVADLNQDKLPDLVVYHFWKNGFWLYQGKKPENGQASITFEQGQFFATDSHAGETFLLDYDQDGVVDVVSVSSGAAKPLALHWFRGKGNGSFDNKQTVRAANANISTHYQVLHQDLNQDGRVDFLVTDTKAQVSFLQTAMGTFEAKWQPGLTKTPYPVLLRAHKQDSLHLYTALGHQLQVFKQTKGGDFKPVGTPVSLSIPIRQALEKFQVADINNDGVADVLGAVQSPKKEPGGADRLFYALRNVQGQFFQPRYLPLLGSLDSRKFAYTLADINADGWLDLLVIVRGIDELSVFMNLGKQAIAAKSSQDLRLDRGVVRKKAALYQAETYKYYQKRMLFDVSDQPQTYNRSVFLYDQKMIPLRFFVDGEIHNLEIALHKKLNQAIVNAGDAHLKIYLGNTRDTLLGPQHKSWTKTLESLTLVYDRDPAKNLNTNYLPFRKHPNALIDFDFDKTFIFDPKKGKNLLMAIEYVQSKPTANRVDFQVFHNKGELKKAYHLFARGTGNKMPDVLGKTNGLRPLFTFNNNFDLRLTRLKTDIGKDMKADYNNFDLTLQNIRIREADFALHPLKIHLRNTGPDKISIQPIEIKKGKLGFFRDTTISFFIPAMQKGGAYSITAYVASVDNFLGNDTITVQAVLNKVSLPYTLNISDVHAVKAQKPGWVIQGAKVSSLRQQRRYGIRSVVFPLKTYDRKASLQSPFFKVRKVTDSLSFKIFATNQNGSQLRALEADDLLQVRVLLDGGQRYQTIASYTSRNTRATEATICKIPLKPYVGQYIRVAFYGLGGGKDGRYELHVSEVKIAR